jgi:glycosyltransferase involved in cell wall biosynthesis
LTVTGPGPVPGPGGENRQGSVARPRDEADPGHDARRNPKARPGSVDPATAEIALLFAGTTFALGGAERIFSHLVRGLSRPPFRVEVLALREPGPVGEELRAAGIPVHAGLTGAARFDPLLVPRLHRFLRRGGFQAIYFLDHAHAVFHGVLASYGTAVRVRLMPVHTTGQWGGQPSLKRPIRLVRRSLDRIIAIAEAQRDYLVEEEGVPASQLTVIPNGVPLEQPDAEERHRRRAEVRALLGCPWDAPVIGITAVLRPEKNHELLLRAFARVRGALPAAELWILGDGPQRAFLEAECARVGLSVALGPGEGGMRPAARPAVHFLGRRADARALMAGFDLAVLSSHPRVETLPLALIEVMDAGVPAVSTRVGALAELVEDGASGLLVPPGDEAALAGALLDLLRDPERRAVMGRRGQEIVGARFSVERMVAATERLLLGLLGLSAEPPASNTMT